MDANKKKIIKLFNKNVRGKKSNTASSKIKHSGKEGHWLEKQMGIAQNASNSPDIFGYEMKNDTGSKTTFGDWSADFYIWKDTSYNITRDDFLQIFGKPNLKKKGRFSWSGEPCPTISGFNTFGQKISVDRNNNIIVIYNFNKDLRANKSKVVPKNMQVNKLTLARWDVDSIKEKVEKKFNLKGWFKCLKNKNNSYTEIVFGDPMTFGKWIEDVKSGQIFFDSGMYQTNARNYSQWRANNSYWENLITDRH